MIKTNRLPSIKTLDRLFYYNPETGIVTGRKKRHGKKKPGRVVGSPNNDGYLQILIGYKSYKLHRVVWKLHYREDPHGREIDHINGVRDDNRIKNLRLVTRGENMMNKCMHKNNTSGHTGVYWDKSKNRYVAELGGKKLGHFKTLQEAVTRRKEGEKVNKYIIRS
jgi:hypothetical protein